VLVWVVLAWLPAPLAAPLRASWLALFEPPAGELDGVLVGADDLPLVAWPQPHPLDGGLDGVPPPIVTGILVFTAVWLALADESAFWSVIAA
jgi:hypothetical protein